MLTAVVLLLPFYLAVVVGALALVFLPPARSVAGRWVRHCGAQVRAVRLGVAATMRRRRVASPISWRRVVETLLRRHARALALTAATLALPPLIALVLQRWQDVDGDDRTAARRVNEDVAALLRGEQLVPPKALPPELFATAEVESVRPLVRDASRQWQLLDDAFRQRLLAVFQVMRERHGYEMVLLEGYRSPERQARLAAIGPHVTGAGAWQSYHQYGLAADVAFRRDGKVVIAETDPWAMRGYRLYGSLAQSAGLVWGGGWRLKDYGHVELPRSGTLGRIEASR